jgi:hypothetical protein
MLQRTFHQYARGFGSEPALVTVTIGGNVVFNGPVVTVDELLPVLPDPTYVIDDIAWTWQEDANFSGTKDLTITVSGSYLVLAQTLANNPYQGAIPSNPEYTAFWSIEIDGVTYSDPLTDEAIDDIPQSGPYRPDERGQWWWAIPPDSTFTAVIHINPPVKPYVIFDSAPESVTAGDQARFQVSIPLINPLYPLPKTFPWQIINGTSSDADFVTTTGNVTFDLDHSEFVVDTVEHDTPQIHKDFCVQIQDHLDNRIVSSHMVKIVS